MWHIEIDMWNVWKCFTVHPPPPWQNAWQKKLIIFRLPCILNVFLVYLFIFDWTCLQSAKKKKKKKKDKTKILALSFTAYISFRIIIIIFCISINVAPAENKRLKISINRLKFMFVSWNNVFDNDISVYWHVIYRMK